MAWLSPASNPGDKSLTRSLVQLGASSPLAWFQARVFLFASVLHLQVESITLAFHFFLFPIYPFRLIGPSGQRGSHISYTSILSSPPPLALSSSPRFVRSLPVGPRVPRSSLLTSTPTRFFVCQLRHSTLFTLHASPSSTSTTAFCILHPAFHNSSYSSISSFLSRIYQHPDTTTTRTLHLDALSQLSPRSFPAASSALAVARRPRASHSTNAHFSIPHHLRHYHGLFLHHALQASLLNHPLRPLPQQATPRKTPRGRPARRPRVLRHVERLERRGER